MIFLFRGFFFYQTGLFNQPGVRSEVSLIQYNSTTSYAVVVCNVIVNFLKVIGHLFLNIDFINCNTKDSF